MVRASSLWQFCCLCSRMPHMTPSIVAALMNLTRDSNAYPYSSSQPFIYVSLDVPNTVSKVISFFRLKDSLFFFGGKFSFPIATIYFIFHCQNAQQKFNGISQLLGDDAMDVSKRTTLTNDVMVKWKTKG